MNTEKQTSNYSAKAEVAQFRTNRSYYYIVSRELKNAPYTAWIGMVITLSYIFVAIFASLLAPYGESQVFPISYGPWSDEFILGTDHIGRDILTRLIYGARNTIGIAFLTTVLAFAIGVSLGLIAAINRDTLIDQILSRLVDVLMAIPLLIFALMLLSIFGPSAINIIIIIAILDSTRVYRLTRAVALNIVVMDYVEAARMRGEWVIWIMKREILPNIMPPLVAEFGLRFCFVFLSIAALSFLGVGIQPPSADWGSMVREMAGLIQFAEFDTQAAITPLLPLSLIHI